MSFLTNFLNWLDNNTQLIAFFDIWNMVLSVFVPLWLCGFVICRIIKHIRRRS